MAVAGPLLLARAKYEPELETVSDICAKMESQQETM
jgi:hypothetical protein